MPSVVIAAAVAIVVIAVVAIRDEHSSLDYLLFRACTEAQNSKPSLIILCLLVSRSHRQRLLPAA